jgi:Baseplate J-like protein/DNA polymerase III beta subunit, N-terminal domain
MAIPAPQLDSRTWTELTAEAESLLPGLAPEWTDYNLHDPGITLVELLAWLTELQLYRVDRVTPALRRAYLRLLGVVPHAPGVARTAIAVRAVGPPGLTLAAGTQVTDAAGNVVFESTDDLFVGHAWLDLGDRTPGSGLIVCEAGGRRVDLTAWNGGDRAFEPLGPSPRPGNALLLGFDGPPIPPAGELSLYLWTEGWETDGEAVRRLAEEWWAVDQECRSTPAGPRPSRPALVSVTCSARELARALRVYDARTPLTTNAALLLLEARGDRLRLSSADGVPSSRVRLPARVAVEGAVIVPGRQLKESVRSLPAGDVTLTYDGGPIATFTSGSTAVDLPAYPPGDRPWLRHYGARTTWEAWDGTAWAPLGSVVDETRSLTLSGRVRLAGPGTHPSGPGDARYWLRCRLADGGYDCPPRLLAIAVNAVPVRHAATTQATQELGRSSGAPSEQYALETAPIVPASTDIEVVKGNNITRDGTWYEVADWDESGPDDRHYRLDPAAGTIEFGDGRVGRVPSRGSTMRALGYEVGGGAAGNVRGGTLVRTLPPAAVVDTVQPFAAIGGSEPETVDRAHGRTLDRLASTTRGVTLDDFERLARETPGTPVGRAIALPGRHPAYPCLSAPGVVTVVVLPPCGDRPVPSPAMLREITCYLERRRPLTTELHVAGPEYVGVEVSATLHAAHTAGDVRADAQETLDQFFHPLHGGEDGHGWPLGRAVLQSEVLAVLANVAGVAFADELLIRVVGEEPARPCGCAGAVSPDRGSLCGNLALCGIQLVDSRAHPLRVVKE